MLSAPNEGSKIDSFLITYVCSGDGQADLEILWLDVSWPNVLWTGLFVSGNFSAVHFVSGHFVAIPNEILATYAICAQMM